MFDSLAENCKKTTLGETNWIFNLFKCPLGAHQGRLGAEFAPKTDFWHDKW